MEDQRNVVITFTCQAGINAVVSGIFFDPPTVTPATAGLEQGTTIPGDGIGTASPAAVGPIGTSDFTGGAPQDDLAAVATSPASQVVANQPVPALEVGEPRPLAVQALSEKPKGSAMGLGLE